MLETEFPRIPGDIGNATTWPFPVDFAERMPASMPKASIMPPPPKSPTALTGGVGFSPSRPKL